MRQAVAVGVFSTSRDDGILTYFLFRVWGWGSRVLILLVRSREFGHLVDILSLTPYFPFVGCPKPSTLPPIP